MKDGGTENPPAVARRGAGTQVLRTATIDAATQNPMTHLAGRIGDDLALVTLFVTPSADFEAVITEAETAFPGSDVVACTTAGEIGTAGYEVGQIVCIGFPKQNFISKSIEINALQDDIKQSSLDQIALERVEMLRTDPDMDHGFAFLVVDGLSLKEDMLAASIAPALRDMPLFGGSAGDGVRFEQTRVALNGKSHRDAAILTLIRTDLETQVFSLDHLVPTERKMVVTEADPNRRIVKSINAEPAAREYARIVGKDPDQLDQFTFASHPVVVRIGSAHHVRAIQQVNEAGELVFFSAVDEGMVLTLADPQHMASHLDAKLSELAERGPLANIIGCDCILRRIEAEQKQMTRDVSDVLARHKVTGFSTYGEQIGPLHVNHTMSGVAIYAQHRHET